ncbi:MAG: methyltransferase domain-containing protein [Planctomycetota bacterium]
MTRRTNRGNRLTYALWSPVYDPLIGLAPFRKARAKAHERLALQPGERVLLVGVGTGVDLPLLPSGVEATGIDLSRSMLARARKRLPIEGRRIKLLEADAQAMPFADASFDTALLALVLSVVPDGAACLVETCRLLKPGARAVVFDKFLTPDSKPSVGRRALNLLMNFFGTDINRAIGPMVAACGCEIVADEPAAFGGAYRVIGLRRMEDAT